MNQTQTKRKAKMSEILKLLNDENVNVVVNDILVALEDKQEKDKLDFDFRLSNGSMERLPIVNRDILKAIVELHGSEVPAPNTWFSFDTKLNSMIGYIKDIVCNSVDNNSMTEEESNAIYPFMKKIINTINTNPDFYNRLKKALRKHVINQADEEVFPLNDCRLILFEFGAKEDYGDIIKVRNYSRVNKSTGQFVGEKSGVSQDLLKRRREIGYERNQNSKEVYDRIVTEQKLAGNPIYTDTLPEDVEVVTEAKECHLDLFADYAPIPKEELVAKLVETSKPSWSITLKFDQESPFSKGDFAGSIKDHCLHLPSAIKDIAETCHCRSIVDFISAIEMVPSAFAKVLNWTTEEVLEARKCLINQIVEKYPDMNDLKNLKETIVPHGYGDWNFGAVEPEQNS